MNEKRTPLSETLNVQTMKGHCGNITEKARERKKQKFRTSACAEEYC